MAVDNIDSKRCSNTRRAVGTSSARECVRPVLVALFEDMKASATPKFRSGNQDGHRTEELEHDCRGPLRKQGDFARLPNLTLQGRRCFLGLDYGWVECKCPMPFHGISVLLIRCKANLARVMSSTVKSAPGSKCMMCSSASLASRLASSSACLKGNLENNLMRCVGMEFDLFQNHCTTLGGLLKNCMPTCWGLK